MRIKKQRPGQIGDYWPSKKPGRTGPDDPWCRTWHDRAARQVRRVSLGTTDISEASIELAKWVAANERPHQASSHEVLIETVLLAYWNDRGKTLVGKSTKRELAFWQEYWGGRTVSAITPEEQRKFQLWVRRGKLKASSVDRVLAAGRAALNYAFKQQMITSVPFIFTIESREERQSRDPMGLPITVDQMAKFFDAIEHRHLFILAVLAVTTLARPAALYDLRRNQYDQARQRLHLNPNGRVQTKKNRPQIPVAPTLRPWLDWEARPDAFLVSSDGHRMTGLRKLWNSARVRAELPVGITPYSFRHGMAREMSSRGVPLEQISYFLGHSMPGSSTTRIYAPYDPSYCKDAISAIEAVLSEVRLLLRINSLDDPSASFLPARTRFAGMGDAKRARMRQLLEAGFNCHAISKELGVSSTAVYKFRKKLQ